MKLNQWPPAIVIYSDLWLSPYDGRVIPIPLLPIIQISKSSRDEADLLAHELVHVRQLWRTAWLHVPLYLLNPVYRLQAEVEAFREQLRVNGGRGRHILAQCLSENYKLYLPFAVALSLLSDDR